MPQQPARKECRFVFFYCQIEQTVSRVDQLTILEIFIARHESWLAQAVQQRDDFFVLQPFASDINTDPFYMDAPTHQQQPLAPRNVFVQDVQAALCSRTNSSACLSNAWLANCTASLMASKLTLLFHSSTIISHAIPLATCSSTSATNTRVPRNVGLPWQIRGSATM